MYSPDLKNVRFVVNKDAGGRPVDQGDSTFLTGIQAHVLALQGRYDDARLLQNGPRKINYYRHPTLLDRGTSIDMLLPWFLNAATWPKVFDAPDFGPRKYEFWPPLGSWMFWPATLRVELALNPRGHGRYYTNHLLMLRAATTYRRTMDRTLLAAMRRYVKRVEGLTAINGEPWPNTWFDYLCDNERRPTAWVDNAHEWPYQRDPRDGNRSGGVFGLGARTFHRERVLLADGTLTAPLDLRGQFEKVVVGNNERG